MSFSLLDIKEYFFTLFRDLDLAHDFIFTNDEDGLRSAMQQYKEDYMFVDYGEIVSEIDSQNRLFDSFDMAVTLAWQFGQNPCTNDEIIKKQDELLRKMHCMIARMLSDQCCASWLEYLSEKYQIVPFVAPDLKRSIGWTLLFSLEGFDIFGVRRPCIQR